MQWFALVLERGIHRRHLLDHPPEARQGRLDLRAAHLNRVDGCECHDLPLGVVGIGGDAQPHAGAVGL